MKKFYLLTKTLLVMALLSVGASNAWGETLNATVKMTYVDKYNGNADVAMGEITGDNTAKAGYNTISSNTVAQPGTDWSTGYITYLQVDASALPAGATITNASLTFNQSGSTDSKRTTCVGAGYNSSAWSSTMTYNTADRSITLVGDVVWTSTKSAATFESKTINITAAFAGEDDNIVTILLYETQAAGCYIKNPSVTITYTTETAYSVTFAETNSVAATVKIGGSDVTSGTLLANGTYDFTATATGYQDYEGSFTVSGEDKEVSFTMTPKTVYNYSVNAVDGEEKIIKANIVSGTCYANESASFYLPSCVLVDGKLYFREAEDSYKSQTVTSNNQVFSYGYTSSTVDNVVFFVEGESISGASTATATNNQRLASEGYMGRGSNLAVTTLPAGAYTVYVKYINTNASAQSLLVKAGDVDVINATDVTVRPTKSGSVSLSESTAITLTAAGSSTSGVDYIYIVKTAEVATIGSTGWTTFASPYALNLSSMTASTGDVTAYYASEVGAESVIMTSTESSAVIANEGLMLKGTVGAKITIPFAASAGSALSGNLLVGCYEETPLSTDASLYVLVNNGGTAEFQSLDEHGATIPAGKAYLDVSLGLSARALRIVFADDITGISDAQAEVKAAKEGKFFENGKLVIFKNGKKFNANGTEIK